VEVGKAASSLRLGRLLSIIITGERRPEREANKPSALKSLNDFLALHMKTISARRFRCNLLVMLGFLLPRTLHSIAVCRSMRCIVFISLGFFLSETLRVGDVGSHSAACNKRRKFNKPCDEASPSRSLRHDENFMLSAIKIVSIPSVRSHVMNSFRSTLNDALYIQIIEMPEIAPETPTLPACAMLGRESALWKDL
jgi:hypothetical protein